MPRWYKGLQTFLARFFGGACHVFYKPTQSECCFMNRKCRSTNEYISQILRCFGKTLVAPVINHFHIVMRNFEISKHFRFKPNSLKPPAAFGLEAQPGWSTFIRPKTGSCTSKIAYKMEQIYAWLYLFFFFSEGNSHFCWPQPPKKSTPSFVHHQTRETEKNNYHPMGPPGSLPQASPKPLASSDSP